MNNYNCGWCGKVSKEYIASCITDDCAMRPFSINKSLENWLTESEKFAIVPFTADFNKKANSIDG